MDLNRLIKMLFESLNYQYETDRRNIFQHMKELIDQIYGVENEVVEKAEQRFFISKTAPKSFELRAQVSKFAQREDKVKAFISNIKTSEAESSLLTKEVFLMTDAKVRL